MADTNEVARFANMIGATRMVLQTSSDERRLILLTELLSNTSRQIDNQNQ